MKDTMYSLLFPARKIPDGEKVFRPTGETAYTLRDTLKIYAAPGKEILNENKDSYYLISEDGHISQIPGNKMLRMDFHSLEDLQDFLDLYRIRENAD